MADLEEDLVAARRRADAMKETLDDIAEIVGADLNASSGDDLIAKVRNIVDTSRAWFAVWEKCEGVDDKLLAADENLAAVVRTLPACKE